jgi:hypothetical protein
MDETLLTALGTIYLALLPGLSDAQRECANETLLEMADRPATPSVCAEWLRVIASSAADRGLPDPPPSRHLRVIAGGMA